MAEPSDALPEAPRRSWHRILRAILLLALLVVAVDALWIEPYRLEVTHYEIQAPLATPLKIADLSDLHTHGLGRREKRVVAILAAEKPDLIVVTGDTLAGYGGTYRMCEQLYRQLRAPLGVWVVRGNFENWHPVKHERAFYQAVGVHFLLNASARVRPDVWLVGLDDPSSGTPRLDAALAGVPAGGFTIALFHSPGFFDRAAGRVNLCLAGHTHGGQVRLPFLDPLWLPSGCGRFVEGWYEERGSRMYVNRGVGWSVLPIRFRCRPEVAILTLEP